MLFSGGVIPLPIASPTFPAPGLQAGALRVALHRNAELLWQMLPREEGSPWNLAGIFPFDR